MHSFFLPDADVSAAFLLLRKPCWAISLRRADDGRWGCCLPLTPGRYAYRVVTFGPERSGDRDEQKRPKPIVSPVECVLEVVGPVP